MLTYKKSMNTVGVSRGVFSGNKRGVDWVHVHVFPHQSATQNRNIKLAITSFKMQQTWSNLRKKVAGQSCIHEENAY
jgi:hypothetical protein